MEHLTLTAKKRERGTKGKLAAMRREGRVPCVIYGPKTKPGMAEVKAADLRLILPKRNHVIEMNLDGEIQAVMVKQVERDPVRKDIMHVDFLRVDEIHAVTVSVPVIPQGIPIGVKLQGGVFNVAKKSVKLKAKVQDIPENFTVDVSGFESGKTFYVRDLKFEKGTFITPPRTALFGVGIARKEEEAAPVAEKAAAAPAATTTEAAAEGKEKVPPAAGGKGGAAGAKGGAKPSK
jgi:large subunit ribosomal protein L25